MSCCRDLTSNGIISMEDISIPDSVTELYAPPILLAVTAAYANDLCCGV